MEALAATWRDSRIKQAILARTLDVRRRHQMSSTRAANNQYMPKER
jgi:hypothetical protein